MKKIFTCLLVSLVFFNGPIGLRNAQAAITPLSLSVFPPLQFPPDDFTITGLRVSLLWGKHRDIYGLDLGVIGNITTQRFVGIGLAGGANWTKGETTILGLQLAGLANINQEKTNVYGLQAALGANVNTAASRVLGFQLAITNIGTFTDIIGFQIGVYNVAKEVYGMQIGVVNVAESLHGLQIGLMNVHHKGLIGVSPILNIGF